MATTGHGGSGHQGRKAISSRSGVPPSTRSVVIGPASRTRRRPAVHGAACPSRPPPTGGSTCRGCLACTWG